MVRSSCIPKKNVDGRLTVQCTVAHDSFGDTLDIGIVTVDELAQRLLLQGIFGGLCDPLFGIRGLVSSTFGNALKYVPGPEYTKVCQHSKPS